MIKIILTGSIATGKTTVADILKKYGAIIIDTDIITHQIYNHPTPTTEKILNEFGEEYLENGQINRKKLAELVFKDKNALEKLNSIVHPDVRNQVKLLTEKYQKLEKENNLSYLVIYVIPLYFEVGKHYESDYVLVASCSEDNQIKRLMKRGNFSYQEARVRINAQIPISDKVKESDFVIDTNQSFDKIESDLKDLIKSWEWDIYEES
ncbi:MAG: dephospho-CoA kinase [Candidatus Sericytochromatia bacterium]